MGKETDNSRKNAIEDRPFWLDPINSRVMPLEMEIKMMEKNRRKEKKKDGKDKKKKDKDKNDRERSRENQVSDDDSVEASVTPKKPGKRKHSSRDSDDSSFSDNEWKKCGLKGNVSPLTPPLLTVRERTEISPGYSTDMYKQSTANSSNACNSTT